MNLELFIEVLKGATNFRAGAVKGLKVKGSTLTLTYTDIDNNSTKFRITVEEIGEGSGTDDKTK